MASGLYSGASGLAIGTGLYRGTSGLWSGASGLVTGWGGSGGGLPTDGSPTLVLDFVGSGFTTNYTLDMSFTDSTYSMYNTDPVAPAFANFWAWR